MAPSSEGACEPDECPAAAAACDDEIEASIDSAAEAEADVDGTGGAPIACGGGIIRPEVLSPLIPTPASSPS